MRIILALPLFALAACNVEHDGANDQMRVDYNEQKVRDTASDVARTAKEIGAGVGNVAASAGQAIENEVGDIDVDVDVNRNRNGDTATANQQ